jgi:FdrA protein
MLTNISIRKNQYYDSVFLMGFNNRLSKVDGVMQSAIFMGTEANKEVLTGLGFEAADFLSASANDLIIAVQTNSQTTIDEIQFNLDVWLTEVTVSKAISEIRSLDQALSVRPDANLVVISLPGEYAAHECRRSLEAGKNVFLFSDNVPLEDEISLKEFASQKGLIVMGPDCGTSLINGIGIGFANSVRHGSIGVIAAAGTGLQEFTCMVHNRGYGISHAIGTGGRDLSNMVGGLTTLSALNALENDPSTRVVAILSKPPGDGTLTKLIEHIGSCKKPVVCCFLGKSEKIPGEGEIFKRAGVIDDAVRLSIEAMGGQIPAEESSELVRLDRLAGGKCLRGVFAGGTFCYQAQQILRDAGIMIHSNAPLEKSMALGSPTQSIGHTIVDMGDEYFMVGRPHPMINGSQRALRILQEARDPEIGILLLDFILGYNSSLDPVGELVDAIQEAQRIVRTRGGELNVVASICGTEGDAQEITIQKKKLFDCNVRVFESNATAVRYCAAVIKRSL